MIKQESDKIIKIEINRIWSILEDEKKKSALAKKNKIDF